MAKSPRNGHIGDIWKKGVFNPKKGSKTPPKNHPKRGLIYNIPNLGISSKSGDFQDFGGNPKIHHHPPD